ncbi:hypothetical protein ASF45_31965 [Pseudorhodoferax sp. Leaf265]|nr:hypothetical protein ASF45_31965 [Pseudorhodoferax sp. Leaf265]
MVFLVVLGTTRLLAVWARMAYMGTKETMSLMEVAVMIFSMEALETTFISSAGVMGAIRLCLLLVPQSSPTTQFGLRPVFLRRILI